MSMIRRRMLFGGGGSSMPNYLCFTALESGTFTLTIGASLSTANLSYIEYSLDNGNTWAKTNNVGSTQVIITTPTVSAGDKVYWRGSGVRNNALSNTSTGYCAVFSSTCRFNASGNICSYFFLDDFENKTVQYRGFVCLFLNCSTLIDASELILPTSFGYDCFYFMFSGCTGMTKTPTLPATTLTSGCYYSMFSGCSSITEAPSLPATTLTSSCYRGMFENCTSLTKAPTLNTSNIAEHCYNGMFSGCSSLSNIQNISLPATTLYANCYNSMLKGTAITNAPSLPATTLANNCYQSMFQLCSNLTTAPYLDALTLKNNCYQSMFQQASINYIRCLATDISASNCLTNWVWGYGSRSGIFVKHIDATWTNSGNNGVPNGFTVIYYDPSDDKYYTDQTKATECDDHGVPI